MNNIQLQLLHCRVSSGCIQGNGNLWHGLGAGGVGLLKASLFDKTSSTEVVGQLKRRQLLEVSQNLVCKSLSIR
jgi:hypothetical protein